MKTTRLLGFKATKIYSPVTHTIVGFKAARVPNNQERQVSVEGGNSRNIKHQTSKASKVNVSRHWHSNNLCAGALIDRDLGRALAPDRD